MLPSDEFGLVPKFGLEIEVVTWRDVKRRTIVENLIARENMMAGQGFEREVHRYHCECPVCSVWTSGKIPWPIQTVLQYDATLPEDGGEFITSPMLCTTLFLEELHEIFNIICKDAEWNAKIPNRRGTPSSPSIHIHTSVENPWQYLANPNDVRDAMWPFMPELFKLASSCGIVRPTIYRSVDKGEGHHSALNARRLGTGPDRPMEMTRMLGRVNVVRLEWRMFEAAYTDWDYVAGAIVLVSALTQIAANPEMLGLLQAGTALVDKPPVLSHPDGRNMTARQIIQNFSKKRFRLLKELALAAPLVAEDRTIAATLTNFFERIRL